MRCCLCRTLIVAIFLSLGPRPVRSQDKHPFDIRPQPWLRASKPILSARTTSQSWCQVVLYSPHVIYHDRKFRMWYLGTSTATRTNDIVMGYAESDDGLVWKEYEKNPILTGDDVSWGKLLQTPFVLFDKEESVYKMWFVSGAGIDRDSKGQVKTLNQHLGYAVSPDGIRWKLHPKPLYRSGRSPTVIKEGPKKYRMWYGGHIDGGMFEIVCANSPDGTRWDVNHEQPAFPAAKGKLAFDSRYTSTPCVVSLDDRWLLYYSARDWKTEYIDGQGRKRQDKGSPYAQIGVAVILKTKQ